jgi:hypothetical protein
LFAHIAAQVANYRPEVQEFVFPAAPEPGHVWDDARDVFWATADTYASALVATELPLLFVGAHVANRFTGRRQAAGFLLTDQAVHVANPSGFGPARLTVFPLTGRSAVTTAAASFSWADLAPLFGGAQAMPERLAGVLGDAAALVLSQRLASTTPQPERATATDVAGRIRELGLGWVKLGSDERQRKHMAKLLKKLAVPPDERIIVAVTDSTLAGVYGTVVTTTNVRSVDLMEAPVATARSTADPGGIAIQDRRLLVGPGQAHTLPSHLNDAEMATLQVFLADLLAGHLDETAA